MGEKPTDDDILEALAPSRYDPAPRLMTYVIRNKLKSKFPGIKTDFVRRRLLAMEKAGVVRRAPSVYATQICWQMDAPAREVTVREAALPEIAARWLDAYDASMSGTKPSEEQREISQAIGLAACFAGAAYANEPSEGADVAALARAFMTALMDVTHPDLDYLRADPKAGQVAREVNEKLRALSQGGEG